MTTWKHFTEWPPDGEIRFNFIGLRVAPGIVTGSEVCVENLTWRREDMQRFAREHPEHLDKAYTWSPA